MCVSPAGTSCSRSFWLLGVLGYRFVCKRVWLSRRACDVDANPAKLTWNLKLIEHHPLKRKLIFNTVFVANTSFCGWISTCILHTHHNTSHNSNTWNEDYVAYGMNDMSSELFCHGQSTLWSAGGHSIRNIGTPSRDASGCDHCPQQEQQLWSLWYWQRGQQQKQQQHHIIIMVVILIVITVTTII